MNRICIILVFLIPSFCLAQVNEAETKKFGLGLVYSFNSSFRSLKNTVNDPVFEAVTISRNNRERSSLNNMYGLSFYWRLNDKIQVESGINLFTTGYETEQRDLVFGDLIDPRRGFTVDSNNLPSKEKMIVKQTYFQVPLNFGYRLLNKKISIDIHGGMGLNFLVSQDAIIEWELENGSVDSSTESGGNLSSFNLALQGGLRVGYRMNDIFSIELRPNYQRSITSIADEKIKEFPFSFGIGAGIYYNF